MPKLTVTLKRYVKGIISFLPATGRFFREPTGGTESARYCYAVWLRHLTMARESGLSDNPRVVAELGPGDSIGVGLAALLTGAEKYYAFDVCQYATNQRNIVIFEELLRLVSDRSPIPGAQEFPRLVPVLGAYHFPSGILTEGRLAECLRKDRVERIRRSVASNAAADSMIQYRAPWFDGRVIEPETVDMVYSQAVLEHVDDIAGTYRAMRAWLKPGGFMSHVISFDSHGMHEAWNGHWTYSDLQWRIIRGNLPWLLNREPCSTHTRLLQELGFKKVREMKVKAPSAIDRKKLARHFRNLPDDDLVTHSVFVQ